MNCIQLGAQPILIARQVTPAPRTMRQITPIGKMRLVARIG